MAHHYELRIRDKTPVYSISIFYLKSETSIDLKKFKGEQPGKAILEEITQKRYEEMKTTKHNQLNPRDKEVTEGNATAYYDDMGNLNAIVKGIQIGQENADVSYWSTLIGSETCMQLVIKYADNAWFLMSRHGKVHSVNLKKGEEYGWDEANNEFLESSRKRRKKAQKIYDFFLDRIMQIPLIQRYVAEFPNYEAEKRKEIHERVEKREEEEHREREEKKAELTTKFKGTSDPLDSLVALVESELQKV